MQAIKPTHALDLLNQLLGPGFKVGDWVIIARPLKSPKLRGTRCQLTRLIRTETSIGHGKQQLWAMQTAAGYVYEYYEWVLDHA